MVFLILFSYLPDTIVIENIERRRVDKSKTCVKCKGEMKIGNYSGGFHDWENIGEQSFLKQPGKRIVTYACLECGYLESYVTR